ESHVLLKLICDMAAITRELELKYREVLMENQQTAAHLEVELEKERQCVQGYKKALISQSQQLMEERKQLQQERQDLEEEKNRLLQSGVAGAVLRKVLQQEEDWQRRAQALLQELEVKLVEMQEMEKNLLLKVTKDPVGAELNLEEDLRDIFKNDRHCADLLNMDKYWQLQATLQKHKRKYITIQQLLHNQI
uniref:Coiled-coil domain containing 127a n=1 Tax=Cyprinus carpio TaxID=7962 RepID=A0A8C1ZCP6_CYPCA